MTISKHTYDAYQRELARVSKRLRTDLELTETERERLEQRRRVLKLKMGE